MASVSAALPLAVAALLSNFAAARPGEPFHHCNGFDEQAPMPSMNSDFTDDQLASHLLNFVKVAVALTLSFILVVVCTALIGAFVHVISPIFGVFNEGQSPKETGHVMIPSMEMEMESAPAKVGYDG